MTTSPVYVRATCANCERPKITCICRWITPLATSVEIVILQHPLEMHQAKGSARLLQLSLHTSRLFAGELLSSEARQAILQPNRRVVLLYPQSPPGTAASPDAAPLLDPAWLHQPAQLRLIVLDATWRKSRKMLYLNPLLQTLPRLALTNTPASRYQIRKAQRVDQLSTLEATCQALLQLGQPTDGIAALLAGFDGFVRQQAGYQINPGPMQYR